MAAENEITEINRYKITKIKDEANKVNAVREEYKRYKKRSPLPDLTDVIDFEKPQTFRDRVKVISLEGTEHSHYCSNSGLLNPEQWKIFEVLSCPGFLFIVNPFKDGVQHYFVQRSLKDFPSKPNITNLDAHLTLREGESIWETYQNRNQSSTSLIEKLRWVHLGYQFDYNNVQYKPETYYGFPKDLAGLTCHIARTLGYPSFRPESGVVNYYPLGSSMGGHVDKYENDLSQPLVSLNFGQSAVYLIGGKTCDVRPTALFVKSGDVIVMTKESRLAYHAVPCIVKVGTNDEPPECLKWDDCTESEGMSTLEKFYQKDRDASYDLECPVCDEYHDREAIVDRLQNFAKNEEEWKHFASYLSRTRININIRQVHKPQENVQLHLT